MTKQEQIEEQKQIVISLIQAANALTTFRCINMDGHQLTDRERLNAASLAIFSAADVLGIDLQPENLDEHVMFTIRKLIEKTAADQ